MGPRVGETVAFLSRARDMLDGLRKARHFGDLLPEEVRRRRAREPLGKAAFVRKIESVGAILLTGSTTTRHAPALHASLMLIAPQVHSSPSRSGRRSRCSYRRTGLQSGASQSNH